MQQSSSFAEILRTFRVSRQYTQEELAERARLGLDTISALERATRVKPRKVTVTQLADALDLSEAEQAVFFDAARGNCLNAASTAAVAPPTLVPWSAGAFWDALSATLITTMQGQGCSILLAGEPGIGKTRLGQELLVAARQSGYLTFVGRCYEPQRAVPYFPFRVRYAYGLLATRLQEYPVAYQHFQEALVICERIGEGCYRPYVEQALAQLPHKQQTH
jgi:transcriptional regulator with XRE-family HTH domain